MIITRKNNLQLSAVNLYYFYNFKQLGRRRESDEVELTHLRTKLLLDRLRLQSVLSGVMGTRPLSVTSFLSKIG